MPTSKSIRVKIRGEFTKYFVHGRRPCLGYYGMVSFLIFSALKTKGWHKDTHQIDHIIPVTSSHWKEGTHDANTAWNLRWLRAEENAAKRDKHPDQETISRNKLLVGEWLDCLGAIPLPRRGPDGRATFDKSCVYQKTVRRLVGSP